MANATAATGTGPVTNRFSTHIRRAAIAIAFATILGGGRAHAADWVVSPYIGGVFQGDTPDPRTLNMGVSFGRLGDGVLGVEVDAAWTPQFFHLTAGRDSYEGSITTLMANVIVGEPGASRRVFRPYASGGVGQLRFHIKVPADGFDLRHRDLGFDLGAGLIVAGKHVGIRGDVRYFRDLQGVTQDNDFDLDFVDLTFMRATVGVVFRF